MKNKIIITGGTGYIGSHTSVEFILKGFSVVLVDNLCNSDITGLDRIYEITGTKPEFEQIDLTDNQKTKSFFERHKDVSCGAVSHEEYTVVSISSYEIQYYLPIPSSEI